MAQQLYGDRWRVTASLPEGGQAHTFLVCDAKGDGETPYVLKRLKNPARVGRFKREVEAIRNLSHGNIIRLVDFDLDTERAYLVMEYCPGGSLARARPFWADSPTAAFGVFIQVCEGVREAHAHGIVHRDLKPDNIFLRTATGPAVVGDFGLCYCMDDDRLTATAEAVGPRLFMAPELEDGRADMVSPKSDVYSLGKILYWLLSGGRVFSREKYRSPEWDLRGTNANAPFGWDNVYLEHANRLLDHMIAAEPDSRDSVDGILTRAKTAARLIQKELNPIVADVPQPCTYCGQGQYVMRAAEPMDVRNFGLQPVAASRWRILVCNFCGHVQAFRADLAQNDWLC